MRIPAPPAPRAPERPAAKPAQPAPAQPGFPPPGGQLAALRKPALARAPAAAPAPQKNLRLPDRRARAAADAAPSESAMALGASPPASPPAWQIPAVDPASTPDAPAGGGAAPVAPDDIAVAGAAGFDLDACASDLAALGEDNGIFEVVLPNNGPTLEVAVHCTADATAFLLTSSDQRLSMQLSREKMELSLRLRQRMGRNVSLTVLS